MKKEELVMRSCENEEEMAENLIYRVIQCCGDKP